MPQQTTSPQLPEKSIRPSRFAFFLHAGKTFKLIGALVKDRRVPFTRKILFFGSLLFLLALLFIPDAFGELFLSAILPFVGTVLGVPLDAGFDWVAFTIALVSLLRVFPPELVSEHYRRIFKHL
jgi:hypothetical protein